MDSLLVTSEEVEEFLILRNLSLSIDFSVDATRKPIEVAARFMAAFQGYDIVVLDGVKEISIVIEIEGLLGLS